jgi:hypothetical protein
LDATLLAHSDRPRIMSDDVRGQVCDGAAVAATVLVDGTVAATWTQSSSNSTASLTVHPFRPLSAQDRDAIETEGDRLLAFTDPDAANRHTRLLPLT